ncbi:MAG TPA: glycosyltransferase family 39 protein, partial [Anaerolineaceae bacterium]|nr:glycosyltransferase family 39 protein [Anaerolineaceae bacterium]
NSGRPGTLLTFALLVVALINLWRHRAQVETIHWLTLAAIFLFTIDINSWTYSAIGDEFSFFTFGRDILQNQTWDYRNTHIFNGMGVYGTHPYLSSVFHAFSMGFLGVDNFGWRFSSLYLAAISIPMFYFFFRRFLDERVSLLGAGMLGCSHYLMTFGKVGYNNLQALFVMGLALWLAGEAVRNRRWLNYTLLGLALGLVFYVYPAAFYILPLVGLLLLMYDPPFNRAALQRWLMAGIAFFIFFCPLLFQPQYWETKVAGTLFYNPEVLQQPGGVAAHFGRNMLYSTYSFLFIPQESHFIVSSYVDPLSGMLVLLGLAWAIKLMRRDRFAVYVLIGFVLLNFFIGATHDRQTPPNTRMFLLLPWYTLLAALGLSWLAWQMQRLQAPRRLATALSVFLLVGVVAGNLYQAYDLSRQRNVGSPSVEMLFLRMLQRDEGFPDISRKSYLFLTEENWSVDGLLLLQEIYGVPASGTQLERVIVTDSELSPYLLARISDENVGVIIQPWMEEELSAQLEERLAELEKQPCMIKDTPKTDLRFTIWWSSRWIDLCPANGDWSVHR